MSSLRQDIRTVGRGWRWGRRPLVPRAAEPWAPVVERGEFRTEWARTPAARSAREFLQMQVLRPLVWMNTSPHVHGVENLDGLQAPVVFISNHSSHLDAPLVLTTLPKPWRQRTAVAAAADYFFDVWWRAASTALVFNAIPIERSGQRKGPSTAQALIRERWNLLVFPEGTRSRDGWVSRFRAGAARLCVDNGLPAVPIAIRGAYAAMPRGRGWPRPGRFPLSVRYGRPLFPEEGEEFPAFAARLSHELGRVWDEDETTWWESLRAEARGETKLPTGPRAPRWRRVWESTRPLRVDERPRVWRR